ncbi:MAG: tetratricopeptide repeat protein [Candidatus Contendobacter sp.]|nr:tetratricopeptide repeat protein [Candidatus Contendobacter sp.]
MADPVSFKLRLLHLSDLHERGSRERESWRRRRVLGNAWLRNLDELKAAGPFDLVCFTGDAADWGLAAEYAAATEFFQATLQHLGVPPERFFLAPGNHDVCRAVAADDWNTLRANLHRIADQDLSRWLAGGATPWGFQDAQRDALLTRQTAYRDWLQNDLGRPDLLPDPTLHPYLGSRQTVRLPGFPFAVHIIGLDSAWLAGDNHDAGQLRLTEDQAMQLTGDARGDALDGFRLALIHHPLSDLADGAHCQRLLADRVDMLLRGHLHEPEPSEWADPDHRLRQVAAGCLYEGHQADQYPNACEVIEITLDAHGRPQRYELWFRGWSGRGFWFDDNSLYRGTQNGRLTWWVQSPPAPSVVHPRVDDVFAGRQAELARLEQVLLRANGGARTVAICSVQGMAGVGKSYLVDRFFARHQADFPGGYLRLALDPRQPVDVETLLGRLRDLLQLPAGVDLCPRLQLPLTLVHIENADSWKTAGTVAQAVSHLADCPVAVSGRFQGLGESAGWSQVQLQPLAEKAALDQLGQELGKSATAREYGELVRDLGYLPLAIHLAAGHLRAGRSVAGFLDLLRKRGLCVEHPDPTDTNRLLSVTFELSLDLLREQLGADASRLLPAFYALSHGPTGGFGASLGAALAGLSAADFEELAVQTHSLSLLDRTPEGEGWRLHPLLAELLRSCAEETTVLARMTDWFVERLPEAEFGQEQEQGQRWDEIHRENAALVEWLARAPEADWVRIARAGSGFAMRNGPFGAWLAFCERVLRNDLADGEKPHVLWMASYVAMRASLLDQALTLAHQKEMLGQSRGEEREAALARSQIADVLQVRGDYEEARRIYREQLPVYKRLGDMQAWAVTQGEIASVLQARGELNEALRILRESVLPLFEGKGRDWAVMQGKIADILQACGDYEEALRIRREEELPVYERLGDVREKAVVLEKIANLLKRLGKYDEALRIFQEDVLPVFERLGEARALLICRANIGSNYLTRGAAGDHENALEFLNLALQDAQRLQLPEAQQIAETIQWIGNPSKPG